MNDNYFEDNFDLKELLNEEEIKHRENATHFFLHECPTCGGNDKFNIDKLSKLWVCWACVRTDQFADNVQGRGNLWTLLLTLGFDEPQVKQMFKGKEYHPYTDEFEFKTMEWSDGEDDTRSKEVVPYVIPKYLIFLDRSEDQINQFTEVYLYLWDRHVRTKGQYSNFLLYYNPFRKRIIFPAITRNHICIGTQSRDITERCKSGHPKCPNPNCEVRYYYYFKGEEEAPETCWSCETKLEETFYPKSLNTTNFAKTEFFYNEQNIDWTKPVVLVEGPFDAINVYNSIAFLGKVLSDTQFSILLEKNPPKIILYMDGDEAGDESTKAIFNQLRAFFEIEIVYSDNGDDPGSHNLETNADRVAHALLPIEWHEKKGFMYL